MDEKIWLVVEKQVQANVYVEMLRVPAHYESGSSGRVRVVPETERMFIAPEAGIYCLAAYDAEDNCLMRCDILPTTAGSTLSSLVMQIDVS